MNYSIMITIDHDLTSKTAIPTADAIGLPPNVLKIEACVRL